MLNNINIMKYFRTYEGFKKDYMKKIDLKDFKKIKKGAKLMYMGGKVEVLDNNGYVLKLKGEDGRTFMVNKSQFDHGGMTMRESVNEAMTPAITFEFPDERRARQFDLDIENSAIGIGDQVGNKVTVTEVDTKWRSTVKKFLIKNKGKVIEESVVTEYGPMRGSGNRNYSTNDLVDRIGDLDDILMSDRKAEREWEEMSQNYLDGERGSEYWGDLGDQELQDAIDGAESLMKKYRIKESVVTEAANVPSNIEKFARERGVLRDVKQLARWAEKAGLGIRGGTAIGKGYDTLVLDLTYEGSEIYFDTYTGKIKVKGQPVNSWKTFSKAVNESSEKDGTEASDGKHKHTDHIEEDMEDMWKKAYGEKFATKYPGVAKIIRQRKITDKREIARIWQETYGEDFKEEYPAMWDMLSK